MQTTIKTSVTFTGTGLHSGAPVTMTVRPGATDSGIWFRRMDVTDADPLIQARWDAVVSSRLCTLISNAAGVTVSTIEHIMAALAGCGIHNALVEIDGPEVPILDGSSAQFVTAFITVGLQVQDRAVQALRILRTVEVREGEAIARLEPADSLEIDFHIDFADSAIGRQEKLLDMANGAFVRELATSRTFCRQADVDAMRARGLALGGTLENAVVVDGDRVLSPGGFRFKDEPVRHKMLDALGDLALAGGPIRGRYVGHRAGHAMTNLLLRKLFSQPLAFEWVDCAGIAGRKLPGVGVSVADIPAAF